MFFQLPASAAQLQDEIESSLRIHQPFPEAPIVRLCNIAAATADSQRDASFRRLVVDIDALLVDVRWAIGNALLIAKAFPKVDPTPADSMEELIRRAGMPNRAWVLLRPLIAGYDRIFYNDLLEKRGGSGTVGGWMIHLLVEDAVSRCIGILDRCAHLLLLAADLPAPRNRMYFRSGKLELLIQQGAAIPSALLDLAKSDDYDFLLKYRDGVAHTVRPMTRAMGLAPADDYSTEGGGRVRQPPTPWSALELIGLALLGYHLCTEALPHVATACTQYPNGH